MLMSETLRSTTLSYMAEIIASRCSKSRPATHIYCTIVHSGLITSKRGRQERISTFIEVCFLELHNLFGVLLIG